jgi:S-DNA-T family DNA segregation ATPase FtsK/SpoIIIE
MAAVMEENTLGMREVVAIGFFLLGLFFLLTLLTFNQDDGGWSQSGVSTVSQNAGGAIGAWLADLAFAVFGFEAYLFPPLVSWYGYLFYRQGKSDSSRLTVFFHWLGLFITLIAGTVIFYLHVPRFIIELPNGSGGILGQEAGDAILLLLTETNATILSVSIFILGLSFFMGFSWLTVVDTVGKYTLFCLNLMARLFFVGQPQPAEGALATATIKKKP